MIKHYCDCCDRMCEPRQMVRLQITDRSTGRTYGKNYDINSDQTYTELCQTCLGKLRDFLSISEELANAR